MSISPPSIKSSPKRNKRSASPMPISSPELVELSPEPPKRKRRSAITGLTYLDYMIPPPPPPPPQEFQPKNEVIFTPPLEKKHSQSEFKSSPSATVQKKHSESEEINPRKDSLVSPSANVQVTHSPAIIARCESTSSEDTLPQISEDKEVVLTAILNRHRSNTYTKFYQETKTHKYWDSREFQANLIKTLKCLVFDGGEMADFIVNFLQTSIQNQAQIKTLESENLEKSEEIERVKQDLDMQEEMLKSTDDRVNQLEFENDELRQELKQIKIERDELLEIKADRDEIHARLKDVEGKIHSESIKMFENFIKYKNAKKERSQNE